MKKIYLFLTVYFLVVANAFAQTPCTISLTSAAGTDAQSLCKDSPITDITYQVSGTSATATGLPSGVAGSFNAGTQQYTISGTPTSEGIFNFTVTTTGGCAPDSSTTGSITIGIGLLTPGTDNQTLCKNTAITDIAYNFTGGDVPATTVQGLPSGVTGSISSPGVYTISGTPDVDGTFNYTVTTNGSCAAQSSLTGTITVNPIPVTTVTNTTICAGTSGTINAAGATSYTWSGGFPAGASLTDTPGATTTYTVTGTATGCPNTAVGTIYVDAIPVVGVIPPPAAVCPGQSATMTATGANSYTWVGASGAFPSTAALTDSPIATATYTVTGTTGICNGTATGTITVGSAPTITTADATICSGSTGATLTANGGINYYWLPGGFNTSSINVNPINTTTYTVIGTGSTAGCDGVAYATVTVNQTPVITVNSPTVCAGQTATLTASGGSSYLWSTGLSGSSLTVSPSTTTSYTVSGYNTTNCYGAAVATVTVVTVAKEPVLMPGGTDFQTICINNPVLEIYYDVLLGYTVIGLPPGVSFQSNPGNNSLKISGTPTVAGVYTYTLVPQSSACNLSTTHTGTITVKPLSNSSTNPGGCDGFIKISGNVYRDNNSNCTKDAGDQGIDNIHIKLYNANNTLLAHTYTSLGAYDFSIWDSAGIYTVELDVDGQALSTQCPSPGLTSTVTITSGNPQASNVNFNLQCNAEYGIQSVFTGGRVFPGQQHQLSVFAGDMNDWFNLSCPATSSGTLQVTVNGPVTYNNSATGALIPTVQGNTFTYTINNWSTVNMQQDFALLFTTHTTAQANDTVCISVVLTTSGSDVNPDNNTYHFCYLVRNSYDPNLKEVFPVDVAPGFADWLTYTIHFQNTGNDSAINIRLKDTLDAQLNLETFQVLSYSHANIISIYDNLLTVYYPNIQLPDSISDPQGSQGFVQYRLKPKTNLTLGTQIKNTANIYFDYNAPIRTNTTVNECKAGIVSVIENEANAAFTVYPNPGTGKYVVKLLEGTAISTGTIEVYNLLGEMVLNCKVQSNSTPIDLSQQPSGVYFLSLKTEKGLFGQKLIIAK